MQLLSLLFDSPAAGEEQADLTSLVPRLYPFFRHPLVSVRLAAVTCCSLLLSKSRSPAVWLTPDILLPALLLTLQTLTVETEAAVLAKSKARLLIAGPA